jgi:deoxyadenosine/deoxycytidine kinase
VSRARPSAEPPRIIAVAGTMGAGKSSLVEWLRQQYDVVPFFEPNEENPYLVDFYDDMARWGLSSQLWFLIQRFHIHKRIAKEVERNPRPMVQDRTIYEDAEVFAAQLHKLGHLSARDWATYVDFYTTLREELRPPDLMVYLRCPLKTLVRRIRQRGRDFERRVPRSYLASLEKLYEQWFERFEASPKLVIETDRVDYVQRLFDRLELVQALEQHAGLLPTRR